MEKKKKRELYLSGIIRIQQENEPFISIKMASFTHTLNESNEDEL